MKTKYTVFTTLLLLVLLAGCGKDNYDAPKSWIRGQITYKGEPIHVRGTDEKVQLQLYQDGYAYDTPLQVYVGQDGSFSILIFDGEYTLKQRDGNGPWVNSDERTLIQLKKNMELNFEVIPYFTISDAKITMENNKVTASFKIDQVVQSAQMSKIAVLLNNTAFVDDEFNIQNAEFTGSDMQTGQVSFTIDLDDEAKAATVLNARVGVWTDGADQGIYSPVFKLK